MEPWVPSGQYFVSSSRACVDGYSQNVHAIGDRANKAVLDAFEDVQKHIGEEKVSKRRPRIEHSQIMRIEDLKRAGDLEGSSSGHTRPSDYCLADSACWP